MLGAQSASSADRTTRLIVEPPVAVGRSVLPLEDDQRAASVAAAAGIPAELLARFGGSIRQTHRRANVVVIDVPAERQAVLAAALREIGIPARPPLPVQALLNESVPALQVPAVWAAGFLGTGIRVAVVDTGADLAHPDIRDRVIAHADFSGAGDGDDVGHGTHVAGIIAGSGAVYRGVAPEAALVIAKALSANGGTEDAVLAALSWASRQEVQVLNLSLGGPGSPTSPISREVDALAAQGILVCVAAGNAGPDPRTISSPGDARSALTVGATDKDGALAFYSSRGPIPGARYRKPDTRGDRRRGHPRCLVRLRHRRRERAGERPGPRPLRRAATIRPDERDLDGDAARRRDLRPPARSQRSSGRDRGRARGPGPSRDRPFRATARRCDARRCGSGMYRCVG